jgi:hypothetical protein
MAIQLIMAGGSRSCKVRPPAPDLLKVIPPRRLTSPRDRNVPVLFGFTASAPSAGFSIGGNNEGLFGVDNFIYSAASVPEPSSLVLGATGLVTILLIRRHRRQLRDRSPDP